MLLYQPLNIEKKLEKWMIAFIFSAIGVWLSLYFVGNTDFIVLLLIITVWTVIFLMIHESQFFHVKTSTQIKQSIFKTFMEESTHTQQDSKHHDAAQDSPQHTLIENLLENGTLHKANSCVQAKLSFSMFTFKQEHMREDTDLFFQTLNQIVEMLYATPDEVRDKKFGAFVCMPLKKDLLMDDVYFDLLLEKVKSLHHMAFAVDIETITMCREKLFILGEHGIKFFVHFDHHLIQELMNWPTLKAHIFSIILEQNQILSLLRDDFSAEKINSFGEENLHITVMNIEPETDIAALPACIDFATVTNPNH